MKPEFTISLKAASVCPHLAQHNNQSIDQSCAPSCVCRQPSPSFLSFFLSFLLSFPCMLSTSNQPLLHMAHTWAPHQTVPSPVTNLPLFHLISHTPFGSTPSFPHDRRCSLLLAGAYWIAHTGQEKSNNMHATLSVCLLPVAPHSVPKKTHKKGERMGIHAPHTPPILIISSAP
jgi:hypothetical protein